MRSPDEPSSEAISDCLIALARARGPGRTFCPSEAARALGPDWRALMVPVRAVGTRLAAEGRLQVFQKGREVDPAGARGPIRYGLPRFQGDGERSSDDT